MESTYVCLRCIRHLSRTLRYASGRIAQHPVTNLSATSSRSYSVPAQSPVNILSITASRPRSTSAQYRVKNLSVTASQSHSTPAQHRVKSLSVTASRSHPTSAQHRAKSLSVTASRTHSAAPQQSRQWSTKQPSKNPAAAPQPAQYEDDNFETSRYPPTASPYGEYRAPLLLRPDNLFHSFTQSPIPEIRQRAQFMRKNAYCPHKSHQPARVSQSPTDSEARKEADSSRLPPAHVDCECPYCGIPTYCSEEHWAEDFERHVEICDTLRQINEDDHDLRSGRWFHEFEYPGPQIEEILVNMTNWDTFLYTRQFEAINEDRSLRQATRLLTYPITIGSVLHELSPYDMRKNGRLTFEGLKSLSALRYTLHPPRTGQGITISGLRLQSPPVRIFCLGARAESSLPRDVWMQLSHLFGRAQIHLIFIGPESMANRDAEFPLPERTPENPFGAIVEDRISDKMKISTYVDYFHTLHEANLFYPYDPYFDAFVLFHPGLGHPASAHEWEETLPQLLSTKVPIICTGYTDWDMQRDWKWVMEKCAGEVDLLMHPGENIFRSLRWDLNDLDPQDISCGNWGVWAFRGKRYEATTKDV